MKSVLLAVVVGLLTLGCSKSSNPVKFSKVEEPVQMAPAAAANETPAIVQRTYTLIEMYLAEMITKEEFMAWFFKDAPQYRNKLLSVKAEIEIKQPLSPQDINKILLLEYAMNTTIRKFNDRNVLLRTHNVLRAAIDSTDGRKTKPEVIKDNTYTLSEVQRRGLPAKAISDNPMGFLGSFLRYGFKIEEVDFFNARVSN